jgi:dihydrofolate synthase/folylpolyglutamate synthase
MTLEQAERYLLGLELFGMRFGLDRMRRLMTALGSPQERYGTIHVVGTNGKSSTTRMIAAILRRHGLRTGAYLSPHLVSFAERIRIDDADVAPERFAAAVERARRAAEKVDRTLEEDDRVTQFEALTAAAYDELAAAGVEVAVVEAGLGGRYDATNVIPSKVQVLTTVGLEHTRWLGPTVADIAEEKLAVVRDHAVLVTGPLEPAAQAIAERVASERHAELIQPRDLPAPFPRRNFALAAAAAEAFLQRPLEREALQQAAADTRVPGRLDVVGERPLVVHDGAHNPSGARALAGSLEDVLGERRPRVGVIGVLEDKDAAGMLRELLPAFDHVVFTRPANPRALSPATLASLGSQLGGPPSTLVADPHAAVDRARALAGSDGAVLVTGSIYLIADLVRETGGARASRL